MLTALIHEIFSGLSNRKDKVFLICMAISALSSIIAFICCEFQSLGFICIILFGIAFYRFAVKNYKKIKGLLIAWTVLESFLVAAYHKYFLLTITLLMGIALIMEIKEYLPEKKQSPKKPYWDNTDTDDFFSEPFINTSYPRQDDSYEDGFVPEPEDPDLMPMYTDAIKTPRRKKRDHARIPYLRLPIPFLWYEVVGDELVRSSFRSSKRVYIRNIFGMSGDPYITLSGVSEVQYFIPWVNEKQIEVWKYIPKDVIEEVKYYKKHHSSINLPDTMFNSHMFF